MNPTIAIFAVLLLISGCSSIHKYSPTDGVVYDKQYAVLSAEHCSDAFGDFIDENEGSAERETREVKKLLMLCTSMGLFLGVETPTEDERFVLPFVAYNKEHQKNRTKITPEGAQTLENLAYYMYDLNFEDDYNCKLYAQTDGSGGDKLNQGLSYDRAVYVKNFLKKRRVDCEIEITAKGEGPACSDDGHDIVQFGPHRMYEANDCRFVAVFVSLKSEGNSLMLRAVKKTIKRQRFYGTY